MEVPILAVAVAHGPYPPSRCEASSSTRAAVVTCATRPGARSCRSARANRSRYDEVDIDTDDDLLRDYGVRIPVVTVDGEERFEIAVDEHELVGTRPDTLGAWPSEALTDDHRGRVPDATVSRLPLYLRVLVDAGRPG